MVDPLSPLKYIENPMARRSAVPTFRGRVQVYTGDGKGKTTAALGLALRAAGRGLRTYFGQFCKGRMTGEILAVRRLGRSIVIEQFGGQALIRSGAPARQDDILRARRGLERCREAMLSRKFDIIVLDEIAMAVFLRLLSAREVAALVDERPAPVELVLTGRRMPPSLLRRADLITEMKERKHYFAQGVRARTGIED